MESSSSSTICCRKSTLIQVGVSLVSNIGYFLVGLTLGFPSIILPSLVYSDTPGYHASVEDGTWIASIASISCPVGCLLGGPVVDRLGRRRGLQLLNIPYLLGWVLLALVPRPFQSVWPLLLGRLLTGFAAGLATCASATYTTEVVSPHLRTILVSISPVMMGIGIFISYLLAFIFQDQWLFAACFATAVTALSCVLTPFLPESPLWLLNRKRPDAALQSLMTLRGSCSPQDVEKELAEMAVSTSLKRTKNTWANTFKNLGKPEAYKPLIIMNLFYLFQQLSGVTIVITYGVKFAKDAEITSHAHTVALSIGVVRVISNFLTTWSCNRWGRRKPAVFNAAGMTLSLLGLAAYISLHHQFPENFTARPWIPAVCILFIILTSSIVYSTLLYSMLGEIFPTRVRGVCSGISSCIGYVYSFVVVKFYPIVEPKVGNTAVFLIFAISAFFGTIFLAIFLPETHGKSLLEIEEYFRGKKKTSEENCNTKL